MTPALASRSYAGYTWAILTAGVASTVHWGKGSKELRWRGNNRLRNLLNYLDKHRPDEEELAEWGSAGEDHLFL